LGWTGRGWAELLRRERGVFHLDTRHTFNVVARLDRANQYAVNLRLNRKHLEYWIARLRGQ
jgi:hypothetical protein